MGSLTYASCLVLCSFSNLARPFLYSSSSGFSGFSTCVLDLAVSATGAVEDFATSAMVADEGGLVRCVEAGGKAVGEMESCREW